MGGTAWQRVTGQVKRRVGRRALVAALAWVTAHGVPWPAADVAAANKKKKVTLCRNGQTITVSKRKKKTLLKRGATPGRCPLQQPPCLPTSADLQAAVNAAQPGATLTLCAGSRTVTTTLQIVKELTLAGAGAAQTFLDGGSAVRVIQVGVDARVTLRDLTVTNGRAQGPSENDVAGAGLLNFGVLTLLNTSVTGNVAVGGGGIFTQGLLTLGAGSLVTTNEALDGGGVLVDAAGALVMNGGSRISGNTAEEGGGIHNQSGTVTLQAGSRVTNNTATGLGGGIFREGGTVTLDAGSDVSGNLQDNCSPVIGACGA